NPNTPLAFLPPDIAFEVQIGGYVLAGTLGAYVWDILCNLHNDYKLFRNIAWDSQLSYILSPDLILYICRHSIWIAAYPIKHCAAVNKFIGVCYMLAVPGTCLLFFLRARAICNRNTVLVFFFFILWLSVVGTSALVPIVATVTNIGTTDYCIDVAVKSYASTPLVHDTIIFL
ncbi:hypothetical protein B0H13DRAFT_1448042, partial [Mycena leptocephala]